MTALELLIVMRNTARVLRDSTRLDDILETGAIVSRERLRTIARELERSASGRQLLAERPELDSRAIGLARLGGLPAGTLGRAFADHLKRHALNLDKLGAPARAGEPPEDYLLRRFRMNHDLWHTLLDLGTAGHEEVLVHAFAWGQLRLPVSALVMIFGGLKHFVLEARSLAPVRAHVALGRRARPLLTMPWQLSWERPIDELRRELGLLSVS